MAALPCGRAVWRRAVRVATASRSCPASKRPTAWRAASPVLSTTRACALPFWQPCQPRRWASQARGNLRLAHSEVTRHDRHLAAGDACRPEPVRRLRAHIHEAAGCHWQAGEDSVCDLLIGLARRHSQRRVHLRYRPRQQPIGSFEGSNSLIMSIFTYRNPQRVWRYPKQPCHLSRG